jgi:hypothetical protein
MAHVNVSLNIFRRQRCVSETNYQYINKFHYQQTALNHMYRTLIQSISATYSNLQVSLICKAYIKVKFTLEQATKAQRGSRCKALH